MATTDTAIRPEDVRAFWQYMQSRFGTSVVNKRDAVEMQVVAHALQLLGIQSRDRFLQNFTTTLGRRIYTPFTVGVGDPTWSLWAQLVVCVHEHQHVIQRNNNAITFELSYLFSKAARAHWEAEAYRSDLELQFWRYGSVPSPKELAEKLLDYGCRREDVEVAAKELALSAASVRRGAVLNEATHAALGWLNEHLPGLRATVDN